jgi:hypothetical protein
MGRRLTIILPFRLPTWNQLLAMNHWQRKKVRDWIHGAVLMCCQGQIERPTPTEEVLRLSLTELSRLEYLQMIQPGASKKYLRSKNLQKKLRKQSLQSNGNKPFNPFDEMLKK